MERIYLDHAATAFPKAPLVGERMKYCIDEVGANMGRASYAPAVEVLDTALYARECLCRLFGFDEPSRVIFTPGQTYSLNFMLRGLLGVGDSIVTSSLEHNALMRPLSELEKCGVQVSRVPCRPDGGFDMSAFSNMLSKDTRLVAVTHASNVSGALLPLSSIAEACKACDVPLLIDAAQTAGHVPLSVKDFGECALAVPGHKGLLGPEGIGALLLSRGLARQLTPMITGGTGSASDSETQPSFLPDKFESGTMNLPGIFGFSASLRFVEERGVERFEQEEQTLTQRFITGLSAIPGIRVLPAGDARIGVVSCCFLEQDNAEIAYKLEKDYGILTRSGLHCAPSAHKALGSFPAGSLRFSFGYGNAASDIDEALTALAVLTKV